MTARLSESAAGCRVTRVMSVSPLRARPLTPDADPAGRTVVRSVALHEDEDDDVHSMSRRACDVIASLKSALEQATLGDAQSRDVIRSLQDRLRLGARMLQAFQTQISRIEAGIAELEHQREATAEAVRADAARLDDQAAAFEQRLDAALQRFERKLADLARVR